jgi:branched-subunit amino acid ABC-type transport system permease component
VSQYFVFLLLGLGSGAVYAALGVSVSVTYRHSGILNFATGAIAMYVAYTYALLTNDGDFFNPIVGLPARIHLASHVAAGPAMVISLAVGAVLGAVLYVLVFRPLRDALPLAKVVATLGLMIVLQEVVRIRLGSQAVAVSAIFPGGQFAIGHRTVPYSQLYLTAAIIALTILVWAIYRYTRFGLLSRAAADSEKGAIVAGVSPQRISALNWILACVLAGLAGILIAPLLPIQPGTYTLFIVPALASALVSGFRRFTPTVIAGIALGMTQSEFSILSIQSWYPGFLRFAGLGDVVPLVVIVGVLVTRGTALPLRGSLLPDRLPVAPRPKHLALTTSVGTVVGLVALLSLHGGYRFGLVTSLTTGVIMLSMVVVTGFLGQISLVQFSLAGVSAMLMVPFAAAIGIPFPIAPLLAALAATAIGLIVGLPALRIRGINLAVVTIAAGVALDALYFNNSTFASTRSIDGPYLFGLDLRTGTGASAPRIGAAVLSLVLFVLVALGVANLRRSGLGAQMLAVRANERAAAAVGIDVASTKLIAFGLGAFIAGLGGALLAYQSAQVNGLQFGTLIGVGLFATAYLAGITSVSGALAAGLLGPLGLVYTLIDRQLNLGNYYQLISGVGLILIAIFQPDGIAGDIRAKSASLVAALARRRSSAPPAAPHIPAAAPVGSTGAVLAEKGGLR